MNECIDIFMMVVDIKGKLVVNCKINVGFYCVDWCWWWDCSNGNIFCYNMVIYYGVEEKIILIIGFDGNVVWLVMVRDWGCYMVWVCDIEIGYCLGDFFYVGSLWYGDQEGNWEVVVMFFFMVDKEWYDVGE